MDNQVEAMVAEILDKIEVRRVSRLARGSVRAQAGRAVSASYWNKLINDRQKCLERISVAYYPEKYAS